jgi:hypothetical protein
MDALISQFAFEGNVFIQVLMEQPFGHIRISAYIHLATPF